MVNNQPQSRMGYGNLSEFNQSIGSEHRDWNAEFRAHFPKGTQSKKYSRRRRVGSKEGKSDAVGARVAHPRFKSVLKIGSRCIESTDDADSVWHSL
jgi:hypothetical protein